jgi:hypothetical protein
MNYFFLATGILVVVLVISDVLNSTLAPRGSGFITERMRSSLWKFFLWLCNGRGDNKFLNYAGMFTVSAWLLGWIGFLWVGNYLIFLSDPAAVLLSGSKIPASPLERFYFSGYVLSTMGNGDMYPNGDGWKIYTGILSFSGFIIITLGITYLVPVLSAEMRKRQTSIFIHSLGTSPEDILLNAWNGQNFNALAEHFATLTEYIMEQAQNHIAYPVLHNFHSHLNREALAINLVTLDEALTTLMLYTPEYIVPHKQKIYPLRFAITDYLATLSKAFIRPSENEPGAVTLEKLRKYKIPLKQHNSEVAFKLEKLQLRRKLLLGMLENDGWHWGNISMASTYDNFDIEHKREIKTESPVNSSLSEAWKEKKDKPSG